MSIYLLASCGATHKMCTLMIIYFFGNKCSNDIALKIQLNVSLKVSQLGKMKALDKKQFFDIEKHEIYFPN